jgi:hypothetical protein
LWASGVNLRTGRCDVLVYDAPTLGPVNKALKSLLVDGSVDRLARQWLTIDPSTARALR